MIKTQRVSKEPPALKLVTYMYTYIYTICIFVLYEERLNAFKCAVLF